MADGEDEDRFEILSTLGQGGMGAVYRARDRETGQIVALKLMHEMFVDEPNYVARFEREVEVARRIRSENVVQVLGYGRRGARPYMVMEYVEGESLRDLLSRRGALPWEESRGIIIQVVQGLRAAHVAGVIHRDIKPSNILIMPDGLVKILDFGIAKATDMTRLTGGATMLGTPAYMAPEAETTRQSDLYAVGCVLYEMLSGEPPFNGDSQQAILMKHLRDRPDLAKLPTPSRRIIGSLLQKQPERRPQGATALLLELESAPAEAVPTPAPSLTKVDTPADGTARVASPKSTSPAILIAAVVGALLIGGAIVYLLVGGGGGDDAKKADTLAGTTSTPGGESSGQRRSVGATDTPVPATATPTATATLAPAAPTRVPPTPTRAVPTPTPRPALSGKIYGSETFDSASSAGIDPQGDDVGAVAVINGKLAVQRSSDPSAAGSYYAYHYGFAIKDVGIHVEAFSPDDGEIMLGCRDDGRFSYHVYIRPSTHHFLTELADVRKNTSTVYSKGENAAVNDDDVSIIELSCRGERAELVVNGVLLATDTITGTSAGKIKLGAWADDDEDGIAVFDNLVVYQF